MHVTPRAREGVASLRSTPARFDRPQAASLRAALGGVVAWAVLSMLPDVDVVGFFLGVPYEAPWGHRGATHSFAFALVVALVAFARARRAGAAPRRTAALVFAVVASHPLLDTLTDGGLGCALLWPVSDERFFAPWRPLPVAALGPRFFTVAGLRRAAVELVWLAPLLVYAAWPRRLRARRP